MLEGTSSSQDNGRVASQRRALGVRLCVVTIMLLTLANCANAQTAPGTPSNPSPKPFPSADFVLRDAPHKEPKSGVQFGPGGQLTITAGVGTPTVVNVLAFSADAKFLAAGKDFGRVVLWDFGAKKFFRAIETDQGNVNAVSISPDDKLIATGGSGDNDSVKIWDVSNGKLLWAFKEARAAIQKLNFDTEGKWLVVEDNAASIYVVSTDEHKLVVKIPAIHAVSMSTEGKALVTANGKEFAIWTAPTWSKTQSIPMVRGSSLLLAANVSADQFAVYESRSVRIAQLSNGQITLDRPDLVPKNFTWRPTFAEFSNDGSLLFLSLGGHLLVLDTKRNDACSGAQMYSGAGALSKDGRWFVGAKDDSILSKERTDGVWTWNTNNLLSKCGMAASLKEETK